MSTLYVSLLVVILHLVPPVGVIQVNKPGFETQEKCHAWIENNKEEIEQNVLNSFGPWAKIKGVTCMTENDAKKLNEKFGHGLDLKDSPPVAPNDFLKEFGDEKIL